MIAYPDLQDKWGDATGLCKPLKGQRKKRGVSDEPTVDLGLLARQQRQILNEMGEMRDDQRVMMAILQRLDGTVSGLANEVRVCTHATTG